MLRRFDGGDELVGAEPDIGAADPASRSVRSYGQLDIQPIATFFDHDEHDLAGQLVVTVDAAGRRTVCRI